MRSWEWKHVRFFPTTCEQIICLYLTKKNAIQFLSKMWEVPALTGCVVMNCKCFWTLTGCRCKVFDFSCGTGQSFCPLVAIQQYYDVSRWHTKPGSFTCLLYNTAVVLIQNTVCPCLNYSITLSSCTCPSLRLNIVGSVFKNVTWQSWGLDHSSNGALQALTKRSLVVRQLNSISIFIWHHRLQFLCASSLRLMKCCH